MAIQAKTSGMLIGGRILSESETQWVFHARDEKRPKTISKTDPKNRVFDGENAVEEAIEWQEKSRASRKKSK